eukprot:COSAG05_NODE_1739_length_4161_cov_4.587642_6_plen_89_part_00
MDEKIFKRGYADLREFLHVEALGALAQAKSHAPVLHVLLQRTNRLFEMRLRNQAPNMLSIHIPCICAHVKVYTGKNTGMQKGGECKSV